MKVIAISKSFANLKDQLEDLGYEVYFEDQIKAPVDVYIYSNDSGQGSLYSANQILGSTFISGPDSSYEHKGTLLIDGMGKTLDEIKFILENRVYSPIFS